MEAGLRELCIGGKEFGLFQGRSLQPVLLVVVNCIYLATGKLQNPQKGTGGGGDPWMSIYGFIFPTILAPQFHDSLKRTLWFPKCVLSNEAIRVVDAPCWGHEPFDRTFRPLL